MRELIFPPGSSTPLRVARVVALLIIGGFLLAWLVGAVLWTRGMFVDLDTVLEAAYFDGWPAETIRAAALELGVSPGLFAFAQLIREAMAVAGFGTMSLLLYFRKPDWFGTYLAVALMFVGTSISGPVISQVDDIVPGFQTLYTGVLEVGSFLALATLPYLFPDGRFVPRWMKWVLLVALIVVASYFMGLNPLRATGEADENVFVAASMVALIIVPGLLSQGYRYIRVSGTVERQQAKGVIASFALFVLVVVGGTLLAPNTMSRAAPPTPYDLVLGEIASFAATLAILGVIASITFAILRYQLWEIDVVIRRTTSYAIVTGLLVLVYFGSVVVLQRIFTAVTGQTTSIAIVLSTLLIAALFLPLRQRVQTTIDRRFFRQKYDAEKTLEAFAATVRDETDLDALTAELVRIIEETMQPEHISVWLRPAEDIPGGSAAPIHADEVR